MTRKDLKELIIQELMARPARIKNSSPEYINKNDIIDAAQKAYDKILDSAENEYEGIELGNIERDKIKIALAIFARDVMSAFDAGLDPKDILNNIQEALKLK
jgi:hypothetical protein